MIAREKRLLADSSEVFKIIGGVLGNLQKIKKNLDKKEKKEIKKLGREMEKLARMSVTGLNFIEINQDVSVQAVRVSCFTGTRVYY